MNRKASFAALLAVVGLSVVFGMILGGKLHAPRVALAAGKGVPGGFPVADAGARTALPLVDFSEIAEAAIPAVVSVTNTSVLPAGSDPADPHGGMQDDPMFRWPLIPQESTAAAAADVDADAVDLGLRFDNSFARLPAAFYTRLRPTPLPDPYLIAWSPAAADLIGLAPAGLASPSAVEAFIGNRPIAGSEPLAAVYSGHQFGVYVPQLGDDRAILLGEAINDRGERWDLHLKGAGLTPFSRDGDGRAVLRSTIREYLCSEAMHGLGIPTTRALCIVGSDHQVDREQVETGAMLS